MIRTVLSLVILSVALGGMEQAWGADNSWQGGANRDWFGSTNWSLAAPPTSGDNAIINNAETALVQGTTAATADNVSVDSGTLIIGNINAGTLNVNGEVSVGVLGDGTLNVNYGTLSLNTLTLDSGATYSDSDRGTIVLTGDAPTIQLANGVNAVMEAEVQGTNGLIKNGLGTLALAGDNTYSGGTTITVGALQIGNGGTTGTLGGGNVTNNGALNFNRTDTLLVTNNISGTGTIAQNNTGTTILAGDNTYAGVTTINAGTLQIGNGGTNGSLGSANVVNKGTLAINRSDTYTLSNKVSSTGNFTQMGTGKTIMTANNDYTGTTTIAAGTLQVGTNGTSGSLGTGSIVNNGALVFSRSDTVTVSNQMSGTGSFTQDGDGKLIVTGNNTHTGTNYINGGPLQVGNGGTSGSLGSGAIVNNSALIFNRSDTLVSSNQISGSGTVTQDGTGTTVLAGNNTHTGTNYINAGTLQVGDGGASGTLGSGEVVNNSHLAFNRIDTLVVSNNISGTGDVTQDGPGKTVLTGTNTYAGTTTINTGTLQIGNGGTSGSLGMGNVTNNGTLMFNRSDAIQVDNQISGTGNLVQSNGTVILTADNTWGGGTTIRSNATLQVGIGGTSGALGTGNITNNGALVYNRSDVISVDAVISGSGSLTNAGTGTTILSSNNTYTGVTTIKTDSTLMVGSGGDTGTLGLGDVVNDGALVFNRTNDLTVYNQISGNGSLTNVGNGGTIVLAANNTYTGETTINTNSAVRVGDGGITGSIGIGDVANNGNLIFDRSDTVTVDNLITGQGNLVQDGTGTVVLTADNTYTGTNFIESGTLQIGDGGTTGSLGTGGVTNNGVLVFNRSDSFTVTNQIGGTGSLIQSNGTVTFTANNTYDGPTTIHTNSTIQVGNGGTTGTLGKGDIINYGALDFNRSDVITVSNQISGSGSLTQSSATGTTILTGENTYSGTNYINGGVLQIGNGGTSGSIGTNVVFNNGILAFSRADDITVANQISGTGGFYHNGRGSLTLTSSNTYSGGTLLTNGGTLILRDGHALGTGSLTNLNGILRADSTLSTNLLMYVGKDYFQGTNGTLITSVRSSGGSNYYDRLIVAGTAFLDGTNIILDSGAVAARPGDRIVFLTASNIVGDFDAFSNNITHSELLGELYLKGTTNYSLIWTQQSFVNYLTSINPISLRPNQAAVAAALDSIATSTDTNDTTLLGFLDNLPLLGTNLPTAFDLIAPDELTSMAQSALSFMDADGERFLKRAADLQTDYYRKYTELRKYAVNQGAFDAYINKPWDIYVEPIIDFANVKGDANAAGYDIQRTGISAGADRRINQNVFAGGSLSIGTGKADLTRNGKIDMTVVSGQIYGMWFEEGLHLEAMIGGLYSSYDSERTSLDGKLKGSTTGYGFTGLVGGGYDWENGEWRVGPRANVQFQSVNINGFTETGAYSPLNVDSQEAIAAHAQLGLNIRYQHVRNRWTYITPEFFFGWRHELGEDELSVDSKFISGQGNSFTVHGPKLGRDSIIGSIGVSVQWKPAVNSYANFTTQVGRDGYDAQSLNLGTRFGF